MVHAACTYIACDHQADPGTDTKILQCALSPLFSVLLHTASSHSPVHNHRSPWDRTKVCLNGLKVAFTSVTCRRRTVSKLYVCIGVGCPSQQQWDERGSVGPHPDVTVARLVRQEGQQQHQQPHSGPTTQASTTFQSNLEDRSLDTDSSGHHSEGDSEPVLGSSMSSPVSVVSSSSEGEDDESDVWQRAHTSFMLLDTAPDASLEGATPGQPDDDVTSHVY